MNILKRIQPHSVLALLTVLVLTMALIGTGTAAAPTDEIKKLTASDAEDRDRFGSSVAISGDTAIAGALNEDGAGLDRGAAYVFERNKAGTDNWGEVRKLTASDADDEDHFAVDVGISGDAAIVGAHLEDGADGWFDDSGSAYIFQRDQGGEDNWGEVKKLTASDLEDGDEFGWSVDVSGDAAIVGAFLEEGAGSYRGAAYIFQRNHVGTDNWGQVKKLTASDAEDYDWFGISVAVSGDTAIVGARHEGGAGTARGAAYVFQRDEGGVDNWGEVRKLTASDAQDNDGFGRSVAVSGDTATVGASVEDGAGLDRGAAYIFQRNHGGSDTWGEVTKLTASDPQDWAFFGYDVAVSNDTATVGAYWNHGAGSARGAAYIFLRNQGGADNWGEVTKLAASDAEDQDDFGWSVAGDGETAIVGARREDGAGDRRGAAYVFAPGAVGGITDLPDVDGAALNTGDSSGPRVGQLAGIAAAVVTGAVAVASAAWYVWRRRAA